MPLQETGDDAVGRNHEVLDDLLRPVASLGLKSAHRVAVEAGVQLDGLEFQRPMLVAIRFQAMRRLVLKTKAFSQTGDRARRRGPRALSPRARRLRSNRPASPDCA